MTLAQRAVEVRAQARELSLQLPGLTPRVYLTDYQDYIIRFDRTPRAEIEGRPLELVASYCAGAEV